jgi:pyruvate dehydrogenase (quinone)
MRIENGDPKFDASQDLPDFPYARYAEMLGFRGIRVDSPDQIGNAWDQALSSDRPVVLEAVTDPDVSILPPHISFEQAKNFTTALIKGDPDEKGIIVETAKEMFAGVFSGSGHE